MAKHEEPPLIRCLGGNHKEADQSLGSHVERSAQPDGLLRVPDVVLTVAYDAKSQREYLAQMAFSDGITRKVQVKIAKYVAG